MANLDPLTGLPIASAPGTPGADPSGGAGGGTRYAVAGMGFSILGGLLKGMAQLQAGGFNADLDRRNAQIADLAQGDALVRGHIAAAYSLLRGSALVGKQKSAYAAAGVDVASGSAKDVTGDTEMMSDLDAHIQINNAAREAWGYQNTADNLRQRARIEESTGRAQAVDSILGGVTGAATYGSKAIGLL